MPAPAAHLVHFYSSPEGLATSLSSFFAEPLQRGESVVVVLRPEHRAALEAALAAAGVDMAAEVRARRYQAFDVNEALDAIVTDTGLSPELFRVGPRALVLEARRRTGTVHVYGEMIGTLVERGDVVTAFALEELWSDLVREHPFRLFCGYPRDVLSGDLAGVLDGVASAHDALVAVRGALVPGLTAAVDLPVGPATAARARRTVTEVLGAWGMAEGDRLHDAAAVVDELVHAAVRRGAPTICLALAGDRDHVVVTVTAGRGPAERGPVDPAEAGRSFAVIGELAQAWGVERLPEGNRMWARLPR
jgi:MEDS: MEthanogen/methylotroph, DcmR Sensory domain